MRKDLILLIADRMEAVRSSYKKLGDKIVLDVLPEPVAPTIAWRSVLYNQSYWFEYGDNFEVLLSECEFLEQKDHMIYYRAPNMMPEGSCGATACVLGHGLLIPEVAATGLFLAMGVYRTDVDLEWDGEDMPSPDVKVRLASASVMPAIYHEGRMVKQMRAAALALDIPEVEAEVLFGSTESTPVRQFYAGRKLDWDESFMSQITPQIVAERLREYVATDGATARAVI